MDAHLAFGIEDTDPAVRVVDFDIAACFEYVDHRILAEELVIQTMDAEAVGALGAVLEGVFPRGLGIPQAMDASHLLGDAYLSQLERNIIRGGYPTHRYVDDFRVVAPNRGAAYDALELAVDLARQIGLVLADGKTHVRSIRKLRREAADREARFKKYRDEAADELRSIDVVLVGYEDVEIVETEAEDSEVDFVALSRVVEDWARTNLDRANLNRRMMLAYLGTFALSTLRGAQERVDDAWLCDIAEKEPGRLFSIVRYLLSRPEVETNWSTLSKLAGMPRQTPWAKLWMMHLADSLDAAGSKSEEDVVAWSESLLKDRHEAVRAEAAWFLAGRKKISIDTICELYLEASDVSRVGIAASAGRRDPESKKAQQALRADSPLTRVAFDWAQTNAD